MGLALLYALQGHITVRGDVNMGRRDSTGKDHRKKLRRKLGKRVDILEARVECLEAAVGLRDSVEDGRSCCDDLIGCLDDCVTDVKELRQRVRDARS